MPMTPSSNIFVKHADYLWEGSLPDRIECPCDMDFGDFLKTNPELNIQRIYHMGSGGHHHVGIVAHSLGLKAVSITFSEREHSLYLDLLKQKPSLAAHYVCYVGNLYSTPLDVFGEFDCITLFHLCESGATVQEGKTAVDRALHVLKSDGLLFFYQHSNAWSLAREVVGEFLEEGRIRELRSLPNGLCVYTKD